MLASVIKVELSGDNIEIEYSDGSKEEIEFGVYERKDANNETIEERAATQADIDRLNAIAAAADVTVEQEFTLADGTQVELSTGKIEVSFPDGTKEEIENGVYERKNANNQTVEERPATADDFARLEAFIPADGATGGGTTLGTGASGDDDGTPDQGGGDAPGAGTSADGDGASGQGGGDAPEDRAATEIIGDSGGDRIRGGNGDDDILGLGGADRLRGRGGDDSLDGGSGNDRLIGNRGDDTLLGGDGKDRLKGGVGDDVLDGGAGVDRYHGGGGADTFIFGVDGVRDHLRGFQSGADQIDLSAFALNDFADVLDNARERGGDTFINLGDGDIIKLHDVALSSLGEADFIL